MSAPAERNGFGALRVFRGWAGGHHGAITPVGVRRHLKLGRRRHLRLAHPGGCCAGVAGARRGAAASRDAGREVRFVDAVVEQPVEDGFEARRRLFGIGRRPTLGFGEIGRSEKPGRECPALVREQIPARGIDPSHGISDSPDVPPNTPVRRTEPLSIRRHDAPSPYQSARATRRAPINPPVRRAEPLSIRPCDAPSPYQSAGTTRRAPINPPVRRAEPLSIRPCDAPSPYQSARATDRAPINPPVRRTELLSIRRRDGPSSYQSAGATDRAPINPPARRTELLSIRRRDGPSSYQSAGATDRAPINPPVRRAEPLSIRRCDGPSSYQSGGLSEIPCVEESESQSGKEDRR